MNWIWLGLIIVSIVCAGFTGQMQAVTIRSFEAAKEAVWLALKLIGIMAFWLGIMRVAQESGLLRALAGLLRRPMRWLFPDVPADHPAMSAMIMNFGANMLGLANAATPFGIKAMVELDKLNERPGTATDAMCLFLAINTSSLSLLATGTIGLRAAAGSQDPAGIWLPSLLASACATIVGVLAAKSLQRLRRYRLEPLPDGAERVERSREEEALKEEGPAAAEALPSPGRAGAAVRIFVWTSIAGMIASFAYCAVSKVIASRDYADAFAALEAAGFSEHLPLVAAFLPRPEPVAWQIAKHFLSFWSIPLLMAGLLLYGAARRVRVYESLVEGAKEGFRVAVRIIPYLVAIIVAVAMFKASGAMDLLTASVGRLTAVVGMPAEALPMAIIRPLSGNGAFGYMSSIFTNPAYGPDSFVGYMVSVMQGSTETTLYVLAVYFGAVQVFRVRHALPAGLLADLAGIIAAVAVCHVFF
ncbi:MAG: spore maturation protein [Deltaproteobacteria bacterium]|nr:spore maturation protein [Deltaproteobacteria bacterium]